MTLMPSRSSPAQLQHFLNGLTQATFGIQHKLGRKNNFFAFLQTVQYLELILIDFEADIDFPGLELAFTDSHENNLPHSAVNHGFLWNDQTVLGDNALKQDVGIHARLELIAGIGKFQTKFSRTCFCIKVRIDKKQFAFVFFSWNLGKMIFCRD